MAEISIIIPVYNAENKLKKCLHSILKQSYQDYEVILVNDGSTDQSGRICDQFSRQNSRFRVIHQDNQGCIAARKHGLQVATAQYTCFCDADDRMPETALAVLHSHIGNADICIGDSVRIWNNFPINNSAVSPCFQIKTPILYDSAEFREKMLCSWFGVSNVPVGLCGKLFNTELLKEVYQNTPAVVSFFGEDLIVTLNAVTQASQICIIPNCVYEYRVGGGTSKYNPHMLDDWLALYRYKKPFSERYPMPQNVPVLMDIELCNMMMTYWLMLAACGKFQEEELKAIIKDTLQIREVRLAAENTDIPDNQFPNVQLIRENNCNQILKHVLEEQKSRSKKQWIKKLLYKFA